jgi:hypothetical protein
MMSLFLPQATEWASSEDTRRSCQSKGKTEVHAGGIGGTAGSLWSGDLGESLRAWGRLPQKPGVRVKGVNGDNELDLREN